MSLYGALFSGVSGLSAQSAAMGAISDNITNVNTIGYKDTQVNFQTLVTHQVSLTDYSPGGVQSKPRANIDSQGLLQSTSSSTDFAISGSGFFVVNASADPLKTGSGQFGYSRAGSFKVDQNGYLQNTAGWYLQGWPLTAWDGTQTASHQNINGSTYMAAYKNSTGAYTYINTGVVDPTNLQPLNLNDIAGVATATTNVRLGANLPSGAPVGHAEQTDMLEYDSLGNSHNVLMTWQKTGQNAWSLNAQPPEGAAMLTLYDTSTAQNIYSNEGRLDLTQVPTSGALKMTIGGTDYTFNVGAGTDGATGNNFYVDPTGITSTSTFAGALAQKVQTAFEMQYNSETKPIAATSGVATTALAGSSNLKLTISGQTYNVSLAGLDPTHNNAQYINQALTNAGVPSGVTAAYNGATRTLTLTNNTLNTISVTGSGDLVDLQGSIASTASMSTATGTLDIMEPLISAGSTLSIPPAAPNTTVNLGGMTPAQAATAINTAFNGLGVAATYDPSTNSLSLTNSSGGAVALGGTGNFADLNGTNINPNSTVAETSFTPVSELTVGGTTINCNGLTRAGAINAINDQTPTTGIAAELNGGQMVLYTGKNSTLTLGATGDLAAYNNTQVVGNGLSYCNQVAGAGALLINQYDNNAYTGNIVVSGLKSFTANNTSVIEQAINPNTSNPDTFTLAHLAGQVYSGATATNNDPLHGSPAPAITFNGNGTPSIINVGGMKVYWTNGSQDQTTVSSLTASPPVSLFLGDTNQSDGMTQLSGDYQLTYMDQNGAKFGNFSGLSVGSDGVVTAQFDNGVTVPIFQIPIATFVDPDGLQAQGGNVYLDSDYAGLPTLRVPGEAGSGQVNSSSLEASTVDIGTQFTEMIVTQRAYSAAAKIITTADQMLDDLINIKR